MAGKDIPLSDEFSAPRSRMTLAVLLGTALVLGCSGTRSTWDKITVRPADGSPTQLAASKSVTDHKPATKVDRPIIDDQVVQATHVEELADAPAFRSSRRITPLPSVDDRPENPESHAADAESRLIGSSRRKAEQQLFTAPPAPEPTGPLAARFEPEVAAAAPTAPSRQTDAVPSFPPQVEEPSTPLTAVGQRAERRLRYASRLAQRGAVYSARDEFVHVLGVMAQSLDNEVGGQEHRQALDAGLLALEEADAFAPDGTLPTYTLDLKRIVGGHQTPVLKDTDLEAITPLVALQQYYAYAQERLAAAGADEPVVSQTLYRMGRLQMVMSGGLDGRRTLGGPKAMALYKAALKVDPTNYIAANELGVLLARYGQPSEARRVLLHSLSVSPQPETYHNLSVVHRTLGDEEASRQARADYQEQLAASERERQQQRVAGIANEDTQVHWVSAAAFTQMPNAEAAEALRPAPGMVGTPSMPSVAQANSDSTESNNDEDDTKKGYGLFKPFFWR